MTAVAVIFAALLALNPSMARDVSESLRTAVERIAAMWPAGSGFTVIAEVDDVEPVALDTRWELVNTLREALRNIERHAGARLVRVGLHRADGVVELAVTDDGSGFAPPSRLEDLGRSGHFGLLGMAERMAHVGGRLHVNSRPGQGTTIRAVAPAGAVAQLNGVKA
jgi:signal transduction histidine kinase